MTNEYSARYDAKYDLEKDVWLEGKCTDTCGCEFCSDRPEKPSMMFTASTDPIVDQETIDMAEEAAAEARMSALCDDYNGDWEL